MTNFIKNFWKDEEGATAIEYGLIAGLIAVAIIAGATALGQDLNATFCAIGKVMTGATAEGGDTLNFAGAVAACKAPAAGG